MSKVCNKRKSMQSHASNKKNNRKKTNNKKRNSKINDSSIKKDHLNNTGDVKTVDESSKNPEKLKNKFENRPEEIIKAGEKEQDLSDKSTINNESENESKKNTYLCLFYSFDIVNSTAYKSMTIWWPVIIKELVETVRKRIAEIQELSCSEMWRVIGDEVIFALPIQNESMLVSAIDSIFKLLQEMVRSLKNGNFIKNLNNQQAKQDTILLVHQTQMLSLKGAAWIAAISDYTYNNEENDLYNNFSFNYAGTSQGPEMHEYLGRDIDAGFRVKTKTMDRRLVLSFELAYLLKESKKNCLNIVDYVRLKGVWENALYPVIWFYNDETIKSVYEDSVVNNETLNNQDKQGKKYSFKNSFRYDETEDNDIVLHYFSRRLKFSKERKKKKIFHSNQTEVDGVLLPASMFTVDIAFDKIARDRNLNSKIDYLRSLFTTKVSKIKSIKKPLELHLAVVCYDPNERKVMIARRSDNHSLNRQKWDFGCAKALSNEEIIKTAENYYLSTFGLQIKLVLDKSRCDKQPKPVALYEINQLDHIKKGIILMAVVKSKKKNYDKTNLYVETKWVNEKESKEISETEAVNDFHKTIEKVFSYEKQLLKEAE